MALTVSELRTVFTADVSDFERGAKAAEQSGKRAGTEIARSMRKAGDDAGQGLEDGVTKGAKQTGEKAGDRIADGVQSKTSKAGEVAGKGLAKGIEAAGWLGVGTSIGASVVVGFTGAMGRADLKGTLQAQLGASGANAGRYGKVAGDLWKGAWGDSLADTGDAVRAVVQNIGGMRQASQKELTAVATNVLAIKQAFDEDGAAITRTADQMVRTGLAKNAREALDVLTVGFQKGANEADDLLDTFDEYGTQLRKLGLDGKEATGLLQQGLKAGARDADTVADTLKEFSIRAIDGSKSTAAGFKLLGLDGQEMGEKIARGGQSAQDGLQLTLDRLRKIKDPVDRNAAAVALFGTKAEDMGDALNALDPEKAAAGLGKVAGAADKAGNSLNTPTARAEGFKRSVQSKLVDFIGNQVVPALEDLGKAGGKAFGWVGDLPDGLQSSIVKAGLLATALGGALVVGGKLARSVRDLRTGFGGGGGKGGGLPGVGGGESVGTMTVKAAVVNVYGEKGAGGKSSQQQDLTRNVPNTGALNASKSTATLAVALDLLQRAQHPSQEKVAKVWQPMTRAATAGAGAGGAAGVGASNVAAVKDALAALPREVATKVSAPGAKVTTQDIAALAKQYHLTPAQVQTLMQATGVEESRRKVGDYLGRLGLTPDQIKTVLNADTSKGVGPLQTYLGKLGLTPKQVSTVIRALTSGAKGDINSVLQRLGIVDRTNPKPRITARDQASDDIARVRQNLTNLDGKIATTIIRTVRQGVTAGAAAGVVRKAVGGWIYGAGGPREDKVPALLSNGEFVVNAAASARHGRLLEQINAHRYADGGQVGVRRYAAGGPVTAGNLSSMSGLDFTKLTQAWLQAAQASMQTAAAAKATTQSQLDDVNGRKQVADLQRQLSARTNNAKQIGALVAALNDRDKKGRLEVTGHARAVKEAELRRLRASNGKYTLTGIDREAASLELQKAKEDLAALRASAAAAGLSDAGTAARDKALDRSGIFGTGAVTANQLLKNLQADAVTNQQFAGIVAQLGKSGLSKDLLDQFTKEGASSASLALGKSILSTGNIAQLNAVQTAIGTQATQAGYQAQGVKAPGAAGRLVNIEQYIEAGKSTDQIAEELWFKSQMRTG